MCLTITYSLTASLIVALTVVPSMSATVLKNGTEKNRIGISVSKKVGNSVVRHHLTRLIREIYRLNEHHFKKGLDIIFIVRVNAKKIDYHTLEKALMHVADIHRVLEKSRNEQNE